jgi:hypothetical protein
MSDTNIGITLTDEQRRAAKHLIDIDNEMAPLCELALQLDDKSDTESESERSSAARN